MNRPRMQMFSGTKTDRVLAAIDGKSPSEQFVQTSEYPSEIEVALIDLPVTQPRKYFDPDKMAQLIISVREKGILEPLLVRTKPNHRYELVAGERRLRAAKELQLSKVPATVKELTDQECLEIALIENLQREDLNPVEEVEGILQLLGLKLEMTVPEVVSQLHRMENEHKGKVTRNVTGNDDLSVNGDSTRNVTGRIAAILEALGVTNWLSFVRNKLPLINLPEDVLAVLREGRIEYTKAKEIAKIKDGQQRYLLLQQAIREGWSLSQIKQEVAALINSSSLETNSFDAKVQATFKLIKRAKIDSNKQQKLIHYLEEITDLLSS